MPFFEAVRIAVTSLRTNKLRSFLTVLGILIGVASVVAVVAITEGLDGYMSEKVLALGSKSFYIQKMPDVITSREQWLEMRKRKDINMDDVEAVKRMCPSCAEIGAQVGTAQPAKYGRTTQRGVQVMGITENVPRIGSPREVESGRLLIPDDINSARPVAVIGTDVAEALFGQTEPLGKTIQIATRPVTVVGVAEKKGSIFGESQDNFAWIPLSTFERFFGTRRSITIQVDAASMGNFERAQDEARVAMRVRRHLTPSEVDDFAIETGQSVMDLWNSITRGLYVTTIVVTTMSLLIGGIVVMNIMLVSVTERIREIGVRKALGARRSDILRQFLVESVVLALAGGMLGIVGAVAFSVLLSKILGGIMSADFTAPVRLWAVAVAIGVSSAVGLVAGIYPASRAAALDPVIALRNE